MKKKTIILLFAFFLIITLAISYYSYTNQGLANALIKGNIDSIVEDIRSYGHLAAIAIFLLVIVEVVAAPVPPLILYVAAGIIFGGFFGGLIVLAGNIVGAVIAFLFARKVGREYINEKIGKETSQKFGRITEKHGPFIIFLLRINPLTTSDLVSYFAGLNKMRLSHFIIATTLGLLPLIFSQTYLGSDIIKQSPFLLTLLVWVSIVYAVFIIYLLLRLMRKRRIRKTLKSDSPR